MSLRFWPHCCSGSECDAGSEQRRRHQTLDPLRRASYGRAMDGKTPAHRLNRRRSMLAAAMIGVGVMAAVDEILFHQVLAWHHFYDRSTPQIGLLSDGLLHAAELVLIVADFFIVADLRHRRALAVRPAWSGFFMGAGGFQLFDGLVNHKVLGLHQIRYGVEDLWLYDILWNAAGAVLLLIGAALALRRVPKAQP